MKIQDLEVGKKYRQEAWPEGNFVLVLYKGRESLYLRKEDGAEMCWGFNEINRTFSYEETFSYDSYEEYHPPKKKKTVRLSLVNGQNGHYLREVGYWVEDFMDAVVQSPAITKDGTVLEFEVEDDR